MAVSRQPQVFCGSGSNVDKVRMLIRKDNVVDDDAAVGEDYDNSVSRSVVKKKKIIIIATFR